MVLIVVLLVMIIMVLIMVLVLVLVLLYGSLGASGDEYSSGALIRESVIARCCSELNSSSCEVITKKKSARLVSGARLANVSLVCASLIVRR